MSNKYDISMLIVYIRKRLLQLENRKQKLVKEDKWVELAKLEGQIFELEWLLTEILN